MLVERTTAMVMSVRREFMRRTVSRSVRLRGVRRAGRMTHSSVRASAASAVQRRARVGDNQLGTNRIVLPTRTCGSFPLATSLYTSPSRPEASTPRPKPSASSRRRRVPAANQQQISREVRRDPLNRWTAANPCRESFQGLAKFHQPLHAPWHHWGCKWSQVQILSPRPSEGRVLARVSDRHGAFAFPGSEGPRHRCAIRLGQLVRTRPATAV